MTMMLGPGLLESPMGGGNYTTSPIRFVDFTLEVSGIAKAYGTDFSMGFTFQDFNSRISINKDAGPSSGSWTVGGAAAPIGPDMPMWHESYPISGQGNLYEMAYISTESWTGLTDGLNDVMWTGFANPDSRAPEWKKPTTSAATAQIVENPGGVAHTSEWVAIYQVRRVSDSVVMAQATVTLRAIFV